MRLYSKKLFSHRYKQSKLCCHQWIVFLILCVQNVTSFSDKLMWNISSNPIKFGNTAELSCYIFDYDGTCTQKLRQWIGGQQYTSLCQNTRCADGTKYYVKSETCSYTLMILNFTIYDVNCDYSCFYGTKSYRRHLQLNSNDFVSFPRIKHNNMSSTGGFIYIQVSMKDVYPCPECRVLLVGKNITNSLLVKTSKKEYFYDVELQINHPLNLCDGNVTIYCYLGKEKIIVLNEYIDDCSDIHTADRTSNSIFSGGLVAGIIVGVVVAVTIICIGIYFSSERTKRNDDTKAKPSAPVGPMSISNITDSSADIEWQAPTTVGGASIEKYQIEYQLANTSTWKEAGYVDGTINKFSVPDLIHDENYYFRVTAINSTGPGSPLKSDDLVKLSGLQEHFKEKQGLSADKRYFSRVMILGNTSAGNTCLLSRLLKESFGNVSSAGGINIVRQCKINIDDGKWMIDKDVFDDSKYRMYASIIENLINSRCCSNMKVSAEEGISKLTSNTPVVDKNIAKDTDAKEIHNLDSISMSTNVINNFEENEPLIKTNMNSCFAKEENMYDSLSLVLPPDLMSHVFPRTSNSHISSNLYATCRFWDFTGQREFYATHQAYLTSSAVYVLVADIYDDISKQADTHYLADFRNIGESLKFWFDNIRCHQVVKSPVNAPSNDSVDTSVIMVFTGTDKYKETEMGKKLLEERKMEIESQLHRVLGNSYFPKIFWLSNKTDLDDEFEKLRLEILEAAIRMRISVERSPMTWVCLEYLIEINKHDGKNFVNFSDMIKMANHQDIKLDKDEVLLFLHFQHETGNIIYFDDIPELIILNPNWLIGAFRCLVSDNICDKLQHHSDWNADVQNGQISYSLIIELFKSNYKVSKQTTNNLIAIMEKNDILVTIGERRTYIMPSKVPSVSFDELCKQIGVEESNCKKTSWLCLKFQFLPPAFFFHIYVHFLELYTPSKMKNVQQSMALFREICVFDIDQSGTKLLITMSTNTIALQLLSFSKERKQLGIVCSNIHKDILKEASLIKQRYKFEILCELHFTCSSDNYYEDTMPYKDLKRTPLYNCIQHKTQHQSEEIYMPWMMDKDEIQRV